MQDAPIVVSHSEEGSPAAVAKEEESSGLPNNEETLQEDDRPTLPLQHQGEEDDESKEDKKTLPLGGSVETPAFCLLDGIFDDYRSEPERISIPIHRLPATLGREKDKNSTHQCVLGDYNGISRKHALIEYHTPAGGRLCQEDPQNDVLSYKESAKKDFKNTAEQPYLTKARLPVTGFFTITGLGKNRIRVNGQPLDKEECCVLKNGDRLRMSQLFLYFLLPTQLSTETMQVPGEPPTKKRKSNTVIASSAAVGQPAKRTKAATAAGGWPTLQAELDSLSVEELLELLEAGMDADNWDRRQQLVGSTLSYRAVLAAGRSSDIQTKAKEKGGASRMEIMEWILHDETFGKWRTLMLTKLETKSYQASITKALMKAGFERTGTSGRYIKWILPDIVLGESRDNKNEEQEESEDENVDEKQDESQDTSQDAENAGEKDENESDEDDRSGGDSGSNASKAEDEAGDTKDDAE